jgi:Flp pilus assembly pilin Flp
VRLTHLSHLTHIPSSKQKGHGLSEYGLSLGLLLVVTLAGMSIFGQQIGQFFNTSASSMTSSLVSTGTENQWDAQNLKRITPKDPLEAEKQKGFFISQKEINAVLNQAPTRRYDLGNGKQIELPAPDYVSLQETLGPSGSTEVSLALLKRLDQALRAQGINPEETIPEMGFFANAAHKTNNNVHKKAEVFLNSLFEGVSFQDIKSGNDYIASIDGGYQFELPNLLGPEFKRNGQGKFQVKNYLSVESNYISDFTPLESLPVLHQMYLSSAMTQSKLNNTPSLRSLSPIFSNITSNIQANTKTISNDITKLVTNSATIQNGTAYDEPPNWLLYRKTQMEANKACTLSRENNCFQ